MTNATTQPLVALETSGSIVSTYLRICMSPLALVVHLYETLLHGLDTVIYYVMNCLLLVFALTDEIVVFCTRATHNVRITQKFFQHQMYNNIN